MPDIDAYNVTATATATSLKDLVEASIGQEVDDTDISEVKIQPDGDIRISYDGNIPTSSLGFGVPAGIIHTINSVPLRDIFIIRQGGSNVDVDILFGFTNI
jgi:hypothetical protein